MAETYDELARMLQQSPADVNAIMPPKPWGGLRSYLPELPAWMKAIQRNPLVSQFRGETLPLALMALPARVPARLPSLPPVPRATMPAWEWPTQAAVRIGDRTFTGNNHLDAVTKAQAALGENALGGNAVASDGFMTNTGRYVGREEAGRMLDDLNQTRHYRTWRGNDKKGKAGLLSEALELYDPVTGREKPQ